MFSEKELKQTSDLMFGQVDLHSDSVEPLLSSSSIKTALDSQIINELVCACSLHEVLYSDLGVPIDFRFLDVNPAFEKMVGLNRGEVVGKCVLELFPHFDTAWIEKFNDVVTTGKSVHFDDYSLRGDRFYEVNAFCSGKGKFVTTFSDITERRCVFDVLENQKRNLNERVEELECLHAVSNIANSDIPLNDVFQKVVNTVLNGLSSRPLIGCRSYYKDNIFQSKGFLDSDWKCCVDVTVDDIVHGCFEMFYSEDVPTNDEVRFKNDELFLECINSHLSKFVGAKLIEADLNIFRSISDNINYGIAILDMDGNILYLNEIFSHLHGYSVDEVLGNHFLMFYNDGQVPRLKHLLDNLLSMGEIEGEEVWHMRKNGSIFPAVIECNLISDAKDIPSYIFVALKDITDTKKADDALKRAMNIADAANCSKSEFLANVSHELRTPLNSIVGFSEILLDGRCGELNDVQKRYLQNVSNNGNHLSEVINEILEISKIEAGKAEVKVEKFSVLPTVQEVKDSLMHSILLKNITFICDVDPEFPLIIADKTKFKHILHNLITNAIKFTSDGGKVRVKSSTIGEMMHIVVSDDGIGIPKEQLPHLYDKFYQVDGSTKRKYGGTGLGLALTKKLVNLNEGQMWVESQVNVGTKVHVMIPLA